MHLAVFRGYLDDRAEYFQCFAGIMPKAGSPDQLTARAPTGESTAPCGGFFETTSRSAPITATYIGCVTTFGALAALGFST
jgi:hypothetical protein